MSAPSGHDLGDLIKWTSRDEWVSRVDDVMAEHFVSAMKAFGLEFEQIGDALGGNWEAAWQERFTRRPSATSSGVRFTTDTHFELLTSVR